MQKMLIALMLALAFAAASDTGGFSLTVVEDTTSPQVHSLEAMPSSPAPGSNVTIAANITDDVRVSRAFATISRGNNEWEIELFEQSGYYQGVFTNTSSHGKYFVSLFANDTSGNVNNTEKTDFTVTPSGAICGNGIREANEQCDGADLGGQTCVTRGFSSGILACTPQCTFDTSACVQRAPGRGGGGGGGGGSSQLIPAEIITFHQRRYSEAEKTEQFIYGFLHPHREKMKTQAKIPTTQKAREGAAITKAFSYNVDHIFQRTSTTLTATVYFEEEENVFVIHEVPPEFAKTASELDISTSPDSTITVLRENPMLLFDFGVISGPISINYTVGTEKGLYLMKDIILHSENPQLFIREEEEAPPTPSPETTEPAPEPETTEPAPEPETTEPTPAKAETAPSLLPVIPLLALLALALIIHKKRGESPPRQRLKKSIRSLEKLNKSLSKNEPHALFLLACSGLCIGYVLGVVASLA